MYRYRRGVSGVTFLAVCANSVAASPRTTLFGPLPKTCKKGLAVKGAESAVWLSRFEKFRPCWHYGWTYWDNLDLVPNYPSDIEYVPLVNKYHIEEPEPRAMLEKMASEGRIQNLLGYNEPDLAGQGNMNVSEALRLWPKYEELKRISEAAGQPLSLGGPVVAVSALCGTSCKGAPTTPCKHGNWQKDFMDGVSQRQLEVDFMPLHIYDIPDPEKFLTFVDDVHNCYGLPIWITEFAKRDWSANATKPNKYLWTLLRCWARHAPRCS